jgi:hypothetical protein
VYNSRWGKQRRERAARSREGLGRDAGVEDWGVIAFGIGALIVFGIVFMLLGAC